MNGEDAAVAIAKLEEQVKHTGGAIQGVESRLLGVMTSIESRLGEILKKLDANADAHSNLEVRVLSVSARIDGHDRDLNNLGSEIRKVKAIVVGDKVTEDGGLRSDVLRALSKAADVSKSLAFQTKLLYGVILGIIATLTKEQLGKFVSTAIKSIFGG